MVSSAPHPEGATPQVKRVLRLLILGPVFLVAGAGVVLAWPLVALVLWLCDESAKGYGRALLRGTWHELWTGRPAEEVWTDGDR